MPNDFDAVYISHLHSDHIGGLEWMALANYFVFDGHRATLFAVQELLEKEVARQVALLSIKLQLISGARPQDLSLE